MAASPNEGRRRAERKGRLAEWAAVLLLLAKGYRILALRYRTPLGEIDLIARRGKLVAFVEVKARRDESTALAAVSASAIRRIRDAGDLWLSRQPDGALLDCRFDIVAVQPWRLPAHFPDAF